MAPKIVAIDGNIGAGKTTFLEALKQKYRARDDIVILTEPVDQWMKIKDINDESVLEKFYQNPAEFSFMFQVMVFQTIVEQLKNAIDNPSNKIIICERSIASALNVFTKMLRDKGDISFMEYKVYTNFYTKYVTETYYPDEIIYLDVPIDICYERIANRQREGEAMIDIPYLEKCAQYYEDWFAKEKIIKITRVSDVNPSVDDINL